MFWIRVEDNLKICHGNKNKHQSFLEAGKQGLKMVENIHHECWFDLLI